MALENKELTLRFIDDYQKHEVLWNPDLKEYTNKSMRIDAFQDLSEKYGIDITGVKKKIKNIRSYFCKEQKKMKKERDSGFDDYISTWFAYDHLLFLKDINTHIDLQIKDSIGEIKIEQVDIHMEDPDDEDRESYAASPIPSATSTFSKSTNNGTKKKRKKSEQLVADDIEETYQLMRPVTTNMKAVDEYSEDTYQLMRPVTANMKAVDKYSEDTYQLMRPVTANMKAVDEYSVFGELVGHKIRKLRNQRLRSIAQHKIFNLLFEIEMSPENSD